MRGTSSLAMVRAMLRCLTLLAMLLCLCAAAQVRAQGTVVGWGDNTYGQLNIPVGLSNVTAISGRVFNGLALKSDGIVVGWGSNGFGQATPPADLSGVVAIASEAYNSLALKSD